MRKQLLNLIIILLLIIMLFILTGCGNKNEENEKDELVDKQISEENKTDESIKNINLEIIGTWKATGTNNNVYSLGELYGSAFSYANELIFQEDGTYKLAIGVTYCQEGIYKIDGDIIKLTNNQYKGDNPDNKIVEQLELKIENDKKQIMLEEKIENNIIVKVIFKNSQDNSDDNIDKNTAESTTSKIKAGDYSLEYGTYKNTTLSSNVPQGGTYTINEDGSFSCISSEGTATGTYKVEKETYENSGITSTDWIITFKSSNTNIMNANASWIIDGNNQFSGVQSGGTFKYMGNNKD